MDYHFESMSYKGGNDAMYYKNQPITYNKYI